MQSTEAEQTLNRPTTNRLNRRWLLWALCASGLAAALLPYVDSGFYSDDVINSTYGGTRRNMGMSLWQHISDTHHAWAAYNGRFYPAGIAIVSTFWELAASRALYRAFHLTFIIINLVLAARLLLVLTKSHVVPLVFLALIPAFFQVRVYHDPMTSFGPLVQLVLLFMLLTVSSFLRYLQTGAPLAQVLSFVWHMAALASYELGVITIVLLVAVMPWRFDRAAVRYWAAWTAHLLIVAAYLAVNFYLKSHRAGNYTGTEVQISNGVFKTYFIQLFATFPLNYLSFDPQQIVRPLSYPGISDSIVASILFLATATVLLLALLRIGRVPPAAGSAALTGAVLVLLPPGIVALSAKYQAELKWGLGYLPVYMQFVGLAMLAAVAICWICGWLNETGARLTAITVCTVVSTAAAGAAAVSFIANRALVERQNLALRYPRDFLTRAVERGLMRRVPDGSIVLRSSLRAWETAAFFRQHGNRQVQVMTPKEWLANEPEQFHARRAAAGVYELSYEFEGGASGHGSAVLGRVKSVDFRKKAGAVDVLRKEIGTPVAYVEPPQSGTGPLIEGWRQIPGGGGVLSPLRIAPNAAASPRKGTRHRPFKLPQGQYTALSVSAVGSIPSLQPPLALTASGAGDAKPSGISLLKPVPLDSAAAAGEPAQGIGFDCTSVGDELLFTGSPDSRVELDGSITGTAVGLAFYVRPELPQAQSSVIVNNQTAEMRGFTVEQDGGPDPASFRFGTGGGGTGQTGPVLTVPPAAWSLFVVNLRPEHTDLRVITADEDPKRQVIASIASSNRNTILRLGNRSAGDKPFHGSVTNIVLSDTAFDDERIAAMTREFHLWLRR